MRFAEFRGALAAGKAAAYFAAFLAARMAGRLVLGRCDLAAALHLGAGEFLSFDANQRTLAAAEGLTVGP